jgi:hypothetical protein
MSAESAMHRGRPQLKMSGAKLLTGLKFPIQNGYMLVSDLVSEGEVVGTITAGSQFFSVQFIPSNHDPETSANASYVENACRN